MAQNLASPDTHEIPLTVFGGMVSYIDPVSLPQGVSPACSDMQFNPGGTFSRDGFERVFANPVYPNTTRTYGKSYVSPKGTIYNLYLYSNGGMTVEYVQTTPGIETALLDNNGNPVFLTPGSWMKSTTAFGREYLAPSDTLHGSDVPLQLAFDASGNAQLDRLTDDGPGASPTIASIALPPVTTTVIPTSGPSIVSITTTDLNPAGGYYTTVTVVLTGAPTPPLAVGVQVAIAGNSNSYFNINYGSIIDVIDTVTFKLTQYSSTFQTGTGGAVTGTGSATLIRSNNVVTAATAQQHNLQQGYQAQITEVPATQIGTGIASIVIDNENLPGIATVTLNLAIGQATTGLQPGNRVSITGVEAVSVGTSIVSMTRSGQVVTCIMSADTGLSPGAVVAIAGVPTVSFNTGFATVQNVTTTSVTADTFSFIQVDVDAVDSSGTGTVSVQWPIQNVATPTFYQVQSAPTADTFQIAIDYSDSPAGGWTTGTVTFGWNGTFYVLSVIPPVVTAADTLSSAIVSTTATTVHFTSGTGIVDGDTIQIGSEQMVIVSGGGTNTQVVTRGANNTTAATHINGSAVSIVTFGFTYQQYGPNATTVQDGTVTPYGQAAPGNKQIQCFFIDRQGGVTAASPPVPFVANGGQYYQVSNIPIGPPITTVARGIAFTGAEGAYFFYIPSPPQVNGLVVGTATQINDNTTTSAIFDFGDPTLFAATGISIQGNNLANQIPIEGALGFAFYGSRLIAYGQRNVVDNLLNMGFGGGYLPSSVATWGSEQPTGWTVPVTAPGQLATGHFGIGYQIVVSAGNNGRILSQSFYEDYTGAPIGQGNTQYKIRVWLKPSAVDADVNFIVSLTSASTGFSSTATINGALMNTSGSWLEVAFTLKTPVTIPTDMLLNFGATQSVSTGTLIVDDLSLIYSESPYLNGLIGSYVNNPAAFDAVSGVFGPDDDTHQTMAVGVIRNYLYILTKDPGGRLHQTQQGNTEPSGWSVDEVGQNCGTVSTFSLTTSQANDNTGGGGEEWFVWYSASGPRIFGGEFPFKIAQEIMRRKGHVPPGAPDDLNNLNPATQTTIWGLNDPEQKIMYFGVPMNVATAPSNIWMLNYLGCETAEEIASANPVHRAINSGKMIANDLGRKWSPWRATMNGAALMYREDGYLQPTFFGGNGLTPNTSTANAFGNAYILNPDLLSDDDYGLISPFYITHAFPDADLAQALGIGGGLKMCSYAYGLISGTGTMTLSILYNLLSKVWRINQPFTMSENPDNDSEWGCGQATGKRFWFKFASTPITGTDNGFELNSWTVAIKKNARMPVRGSNR